jgi:uncharacterized SAM-binding protein YcdF (DUF218 family)
MDIAIQKALGDFLLLPPFNLALLCCVGLWFIKQRYRGGFLIAYLSIALNFALGLPLWAYVFGQQHHAIAYEQPNLEGADAIVILGGGRRMYAPEYPLGETVSSATLERLRYGATLAKSTGLPILVSGGMPSNRLGAGRQSEATHMAEILEQEFLLPVKWVESRSQDTLENAAFSAPVLKKANVSKVVLVTNYAHMVRAEAAFENEGLVVVSAPTLMPAPSEERLRIYHFIPSFEGYTRSRYLLYDSLATFRGLIFG